MGNERLAAAGFERGRRREWETVSADSFCGRMTSKEKSRETWRLRGVKISFILFFLMWKD